jgi:hypothetical protein
MMLTLSGCPGFPRPNGDGGSLSPEVQAAVDDVMEKSQATFQALAGFADGFDPRLDDEQDMSYAGCPMVVADRQNGSFSVELDFGNGCTNQFYPESTVSGRVLMSLIIAATRTGSVQWDDFTIDGQSINGLFDLQITRQDLARLISGTIDITISGVGSTEGTLDMDLRFTTATFTVQEATLTLADASESFTVSINDVVVKPVDNGNFIPEDGTISFEIPNEDPPPDMLTVLITFDRRSPIDGTVDVKVGNGPTVTYTLPGF